jgi:hypothetical protein
MKLYQVAMPTRKSRAFERLIVVVVVLVVVLVVEVVDVVGSPGYVVVVVDVVLVVDVVDVEVGVGLGFGFGLGLGATFTTGLGRVRLVMTITLECQATIVPGAGDCLRATTQVPPALPGPRVVKKRSARFMAAKTWALERPITRGTARRPW